MLSIDPPSDKKDLSFQPLSSTSTSAPSTEDEECEMHWKQIKWIVNEPNVMELFKRCQECGSVIQRPKKQLWEVFSVFTGNVKKTTRESGVHALMLGECPLIIFLFLHAHYSLELHIQTSLIGPLCSTFKCPIKPLTMTFSLATLFQSLMKNIKNNRKQQLMTYICKLNSVIQLIVRRWEVRQASKCYTFFFGQFYKFVTIRFFF